MLSPCSQRPLKAQLTVELSGATSDADAAKIRANFVQKEKAVEHGAKHTQTPYQLLHGSLCAFVCTEIDHRPLEMHMELEVAYKYANYQSNHCAHLHTHAFTRAFSHMYTLSCSQLPFQVSCSSLPYTRATRQARSSRPTNNCAPKSLSLSLLVMLPFMSVPGKRLGTARVCVLTRWWCLFKKALAQSSRYATGGHCACVPKAFRVWPWASERSRALCAHEYSLRGASSCSLGRSSNSSTCSSHVPISSSGQKSSGSSHSSMPSRRACQPTDVLVQQRSLVRL